MIKSVLLNSTKLLNKSTLLNQTNRIVFNSNVVFGGNTSSVLYGGSNRNFGSKGKISEYSHKAKSALYHRGSTLYTNTTRDELIKMEKEFVPPQRYEPKTISDKIARKSVQFLRKFSNLFFREKYIHYAIVLETVAAVPGLVGSALLHLRSLRTMERNNWIKILMDEAENERMHLFTFIELSKPTLIERAMVAVAQGIYFNIFFAFYMLTPKTAHRFTGYLEEEALITYNNFLKDLDEGKVPNFSVNTPAPQLAIDYWGLPADATLRDCILVIRQDENDHRAVNHEISNRISKNNTDPIDL
ncbi:alternative oxidase [Tieghemostelium lacteum]|uniref:Alternative oxidase n=1 Tax=Tieghemostelium lacteum TaxID=361077 RepID=A0A151ZSB1_TIELA|nr:alternative oxidase [Tieghemostelium lacteum]|eukprot:KYQ96809.1 alternative oxidase [Tieghemostelium lacteum]